MLNLLVSYAYTDDDLIRALCDGPSDVRVLVDSGAFTAWKAGSRIDLRSYMAFLQFPPFPIWRYLTLDVIGDPVGTERNTRTMLDAGLRPVPVFTRGDSVDQLDHMYELSDLVAIGGLVGTHGNTGFVRGIMRHVGKRPVHWLGFTRHSFICHYRPGSCDTSSWNTASRFGNTYIYVGNGKMIKCTRREFAERPTNETLSGIRKLGIDPYDLSQNGNWRLNNYDHASSLLSARSYVAYSMDVERTLGTKLFIVASGYTSHKQAESIFNAYKLMQ